MQGEQFPIPTRSKNSLVSIGRVRKGRTNISVAHVNSTHSSENKRKTELLAQGRRKRLTKT